MATVTSFSATDIHNCLTAIGDSSEWTEKHKFQEDVVEFAFHRLSHRLKAWMLHHHAWLDNSSEVEKSKEALQKFEKKHLKSYRRWKKVSKISGGLEGNGASDDVETILKRIFLFYLVYGEIHDFRGIKATLYLFYHTTLEKYQSGEENLGVWIRDQGHKLYKLMGTAYSKDEMNQDCFHHDDLDDLCSTGSFVNKKFWKSEKDFLVAFGMQDSENAKFPRMAKLCQLETPTFIRFWLRSAQQDVTFEQRSEREKWIVENILQGKAQEEANKRDQELASAEEAAQQAEQEKRISEQKFEAKPDRWKPTEEDYDDKPEAVQNFRLALTQFDTSTELFRFAERDEIEAQEAVTCAMTIHFRDRSAAEESWELALNRILRAERSFGESLQGFTRAADTFHSLPDCQSYFLDATFQRDRSNWKHKQMTAERLRLLRSQWLQNTFEDLVNSERRRFARKYKTYFERSGGILGSSGYLTVFHHYRKVVYLHIVLFLPLLWLYFEYHNQIDFGDLGSLVDLVGMDTLFDPFSNLILPVAAVAVLMLVTFLFVHLRLRWRTFGRRAPRRDRASGWQRNWSAKFQCLLLWVFTLITELVMINFLVIVPIRAATDTFMQDFTWYWSPLLILVHWVPTLVLYFSSLQFVHTLWVGIFGWIYGILDGSNNTKYWSSVVAAFERRSKKKVDAESVSISRVAEVFASKVLPNGLTLTPQQQHIAFAKVWNTTLNHFYEIHQLSKEELQRFSYKVKESNPQDYLSGVVEKEPDLFQQPQVEVVKQHLIRFVNNVFMDKPTKNVGVREMLPLTVVTPVGNEKILYSYEFITHVDNTQSSFLKHLMERSEQEWKNFKNKECLSDKAKDWADRMEKDVLQGVQPDQEKKSKRWIHDTTEGQALKRKVCEWASLRFQALFRTVHGFAQVPRALVVLARIEDPTLSQAAAEALVSEKFSCLMGYQSYYYAHRTFKGSKSKTKVGGELSVAEVEAHDIIYNVKYLKARFPEVKVAYMDQVNGKYIARMGSGLAKSSVNYDDYAIETFGPFSDMGLGKPAHQNFLSQFIDGMVVQTIDVNQDSVLSQSFFVPNVLGEFDRDKKVKIVGCPEFVITTRWSPTAWCSAFSERTFGTLTQRCYARIGIRLHYGHPDFIDAMFVMCDTGLSKMPYVSEDIFTGFDAVLKGAKIIHVEYHEVGKARDVDLYTTTKFQRKISMGASQMACSRYVNQMHSSSNISFFQGLSFYYSTVGFYVNHLILYLSVWFALVGQLILIVVQQLFLGDEISNFITTRIFAFQIGFALVAPGLMQLWLEKGFFAGTWAFLSHLLILAVYSTFHILNISSYWQWGLVHSAFYLASGRGTGLEHYFMRDMYDNFYRTHWKSGFQIMWMGVLALILGGSIWVFLVMYMLPAGIWLWGAMFLNPGSLPSTVHEEQWKRLINRDMQETRDIVKHHVGMDKYLPPPLGNVVKRFFIKVWRAIRKFFQLIHWLYTVLNFAILMRVVRVIAIFTLGWEYIFAERIPTFIFTDERRRVLRWDDDESRTKSVFQLHSHSPRVSNANTERSLPSTVGLRRPLRRSDSHQSLASVAQRPLPAPPSHKSLGERKRSVRFLAPRSRNSSSSDSSDSTDPIEVSNSLESQSSK